MYPSNVLLINKEPATPSATNASKTRLAFALPTLYALKGDLAMESTRDKAEGRHKL